MSISESIKTADFKAEKHVPVIEIIKKDGDYTVAGVKVGKEVAHPNTTEHYIAWIDLYYKADGENFVQHLGRAEFKAHGESATGANQGSLFTEPTASFRFKALKPGKLTAVSYCNIHGLWESELSI